MLASLPLPKLTRSSQGPRQYPAGGACFHGRHGAVHQDGRDGERDGVAPAAVIAEHETRRQCYTPFQGSHSASSRHKGGSDVKTWSTVAGSTMNQASYCKG
jgi:hypothetical protein